MPRQNHEVISREFDEELEEFILKIKVNCIECGKEYEFTMDGDQYKRWINKVDPIQRIFPKMDKGLRELLISGTCPKCWDEMFGKNPWEEK